MSANNMGLWSQVCVTEPAYTKQFNRPGGFSGTSVNTAYLIRRATELLGPVGIAWGFTELESRIVETVSTVGENGVVSSEKVWISKVEVWIVGEALAKHVRPSEDMLPFYVGKVARVTQYGQTTFVGRNKNGLFTDEEAPKKSVTDGLTKCLSYYGFAADLWLGEQDRKNNATAKPRAEAPAPRPTASAVTSQPKPASVPQPTAAKVAPPAPSTSPAPDTQGLPRIDGVTFEVRDVSIVAIGQTGEKKELLKAAGFRWNPTEQVWFKLAA